MVKDYSLSKNIHEQDIYLQVVDLARGQRGSRIKDVIKHYSDIVSAMPYDTIVYNTELIDLLKYHKRFTEKTNGLQITGLVKRRFKKGYTLYIVLENGTEVDISFYKAVYGLFDSKANMHQKNAINAFRKSIDYQIKNFRKSQMIDKLLIKHKLGYLVEVYKTHIDHIIPFKSILDSFLQQENCNYYDIEIEEDKKGGYVLKDKILEKKWQEYHCKHMQLQVLLKEENLSKGKKNGLETEFFERQYLF